MVLDLSLIKIENLLATSPSGTLTAVPTAVVKSSKSDIWEYKFEPDRREAGEWVVTLNSDAFVIPKGTVLGSIKVSPGTQTTFSIPWNAALRNDLSDIQTSIIDIRETLGDLETGLKGNQSSITNLLTEIDDLSAQNNTIEKAYKAADKAIEARITGDEAGIQANSVEIGKNAAAIVISNDRIKATEEINAIQDQKISNIENAASVKFETIDTKNTAQDTAIADFRTLLNAVQSRLDSINQLVSVLDKQIYRGIITWDDRSMFPIGNKVYGGATRLTRANNARYYGSYSFPGLPDFLTGEMDVTLTNQINFGWDFWYPQWLWGTFITHTNNAIGNRYVNNSTGTLSLLNAPLGDHVSTWKTTTKPGTSTAFKINIEPGMTNFKNVYVAYTNKDSPASAPKIGQYTLQIGDLFKFSNSEDLFKYEGIDADTGAWQSSNTRTYYLKSEVDQLFVRK